MTRALLRSPLLLHRLGFGGLLSLAHLMILTTRGRKTGLARHTAIEFRRHGSKIYVISAWGDRPQWYRNLLVNPAVLIQQGDQCYGACAQPVTNNSEALRVLHQFRRTNPRYYDSLLGRLINRQQVDPRTLPDVSHQFTIVRFDPAPIPKDLRAVPADLTWVLPAGAMTGLGAVLGLTLARWGARARKRRRATRR
ncbi:MAG: nitroreductase family deazaflavin-dependent oxidoreductase [Chloroflexi bacterium]|nr:nitroreductase family deazaflavin-dependent oxidoreductase [Chloroflexota bacterium]